MTSTLSYGCTMVRWRPLGDGSDGNVAVAGDDDLPSKAPDAVHLDGRCPLRHHHNRGDAQEPGSEGDRLAVVAAGVRDDAAGAALGRYAGNGGIGSPDLEGADRLEVLALDRDRDAEGPGKRR